MKKQFKLLSVILATTMLLGSVSAMACTASYVGKDVSTDGTTIIARSEDQGQGDYNKMYVVVPRVDNVPGRFMEDTGNGFKLPLPATTYKYTMVPDYTQGDDGTYPGICTNEYGVTISGTVSASPCEAWENADPYIEPALREAILPAAVAAVSKTAREALDVLMGYVDTYGSEEGNTVLIADQKEAWVIEIYSGHHYAAMKMPTDQVAVFGNQFMMGAVDQKDTENYVFSKGLFELIDKLGLAVKEDGKYNLVKSICKSERSHYSNMRTWMGHTLLAPSTAGGEYKNETFYPLFYKPDHKVSPLEIMDLHRNRYEGTPQDASKPGNEDLRVIGVERTSQIHLVQINENYPAACSAITWIGLGNPEHSVYIPAFSGITDTAPAYKVDGDVYNENGAFWMFKRICTLAEQNRALYGQGVKDYWKLQEEMMYKEMKAAEPKMLELYKTDPAAGAKFVTELGIKMAEREMKHSDVLFADLLTNMMHNTGLSISKTPRTFISNTALRPAADFKGYTTVWNPADGAITLTKGTTSYVLTVGSTACKATKNGVVTALKLSTAPRNMGGTTYVPMDFVQGL
ncbi:MAG: C69 family dipeptidase [Oscillospiraceae bacterium]